MRRKVSIILLAAGLLTAAGAAQAKERPVYRPTTPTIFALPIALAIAGFDVDGDARVSRAEFDVGVLREWARADINGDGSVGAIEHGSWAERSLGSQGALPSLLNLDSDGDDRISRDEFLAYFAARFIALDKDRDGVLVRAELISLRVDPVLPGAPAGQPGQPGQGQPSQGQPAKRQPGG